MNETNSNKHPTAYHWKGINEIAVNRIERTSIVVCGSTDRSQIDSLHYQRKRHKLIQNTRNSKSNARNRNEGITNQICHLDESFEPRIVLDVDAVKLNAIGPRMRSRLEKVPDLVIVDINGQDLVHRLSHELLTEVRSDESSSADHANRHRLDGVSVQI